MVLITVQYVPIDYSAAFLALKSHETQFLYYRIAFFTHVYSSIFVLMTGFVQFSKAVRLRYPRIHRRLGKVYIVLVLLLAAPSGLIMGIHGNGGIYSQISFCIQAVLWFCFTLWAYTSIRKGNIARHYDFMVLSFALTLSAVSLRLFKWGIVHTLALPPMDTYRIVVWLGWTFNILVALAIIYIHKRKKALPYTER